MSAGGPRSRPLSKNSGGRCCGEPADRDRNEANLEVLSVVEQDRPDRRTIQDIGRLEVSVGDPDAVFAVLGVVDGAETQQRRKSQDK